MKRKVKAWSIHSQSIRWWVEQSPIEVLTWHTGEYSIGIVLSSKCGWCNVIVSAEDPDAVAQEYYNYYRNMIDAKDVLFEGSGNDIRF